LRDQNRTNLLRSRVDRDILEGYVDETPTDEELDLRAKCELDFGLFCESFFPERFPLKFSKDHLTAIAGTERVVLGGEQLALGMPRGSGKSSLAQCAVLFAQLYGHRKFTCIVGSTQDLAERMLDNLKTDLQFNVRLRRPFRSVCYPVARLEGNGRKSIGQLYDGRQTLIGWGNPLVFPTMPDEACDGVNVSGSVVSAHGLTGALRGQVHTLASGESIRPDLAIVDDPQTIESAWSPSQCERRLSIINGDLLGMAGPGKRIAVIVPCTVIREDDLSDQLLDRDRNPVWQGIRTKMVYSWPENEKLWEQYLEVRADALRTGAGPAKQNAFYRKNRKAMDAGAKVAWPERKSPDELSAVQHAMNLRALVGDEAFSAEYQNEPVRAGEQDLAQLTPESIMSRTSGYDRGVAPSDADMLTAFIDVHDSLLYWAVCAWTKEFSGWIVDYGAWPRQSRKVFAMRRATRTIQSENPGIGKEPAIRAALEALTDEILGREYKSERDLVWRVDKCLVDSGYVPDLVHQFCRRSPHAATLLPSRGAGIGVTAKPINEYTRKRGDRFGWQWYIPAPTRGRATRYVRFDANHWKSFVSARLTAPVGGRGTLLLNGDPKKARDHELLAQHLTAERAVRVTGNGRTVDEWRVKPGSPDNHLFDCIVGCALAASIEGATLFERPERKVVRPPARRAAQRQEWR